MKRLTLVLILLSGILCARAQESADSLAQPAVLTAPEQLAEASPDQLWDRANTAYINGDYHVAAEFYDQILARGGVKEVILAISTSVEGETTLFYLMNRLRQFPGLKVTSIARGIGFGDELEYVDELTITLALMNRREIE